jgi:hypothetical protein
MTATPTATQGAWDYTLALGVSPIDPPPASRVTISVAWDGPAAIIELVGYPEQTCCADPADWWDVDGPIAFQFRVWIFSNATGTKTFTVRATSGGVVKTASVTVYVGGVVQTATATRTSTPVVGPTVTTLQAETWYQVAAPGDILFVCLRVESGGGAVAKELLFSSGAPIAGATRFRDGPGWRCLSVWSYMPGVPPTAPARYASVLWLWCDGTLSISDCRLCSAAQASAWPESGSKCEVRG